MISIDFKNYSPFMIKVDMVLNQKGEVRQTKELKNIIEKNADKTNVIAGMPVYYLRVDSNGFGFSSKPKVLKVTTDLKGGYKIDWLQ